MSVADDGAAKIAVLAVTVLAAAAGAPGVSFPSAEAGMPAVTYNPSAKVGVRLTRLCSKQLNAIYNQQCEVVGCGQWLDVSAVERV